MDPLDAFLDGLKAADPEPITADSESDESDGEIASGLNPSSNEPQAGETRLVYELPSLTKNIYIEAKELSSLPPEAVDELRGRLGNITVHGLNVPPPVEHWSLCGLPSAMAALIDHIKFTQPAPIQCQAILCILSGRDVIGCAVTGRHLHLFCMRFFIFLCSRLCARMKRFASFCRRYAS